MVFGLLGEVPGAPRPGQENCWIVGALGPPPHCSLSLPLRLLRKRLHLAASSLRNVSMEGRRLAGEEDRAGEF